MKKKHRMYFFLKSVGSLFYWLFYPPRIFAVDAEGNASRRKKPFDAQPAALLLCNHISLKDPFLVAIAFRRYRIRFMAKQELFKNRLFAALITFCGAFPVKRGQGDMHAVKAAISILQQGEVLCIFPEGKRGTGEDIGALAGGSAFIAAQAASTIIPIYIAGYKIFRRTNVYIGENIDIDRSKMDKAGRTALTAKIDESMRFLQKVALNV